jgi:hypothetical protein
MYFCMLIDRAQMYCIGSKDYDSPARNSDSLLYFFYDSKVS